LRHHTKCTTSSFAACCIADRTFTSRAVNAWPSYSACAHTSPVWCRKRLQELDTHPSVLDPIFFATSCALGALAGALGDRVSLGFIAATEEQVVEHLDRHIDQLPQGDGRSRAILERMREDELRHGTSAEKAGGLPFPMPLRRLMTSFSRIMTETTYRI
jgi:ubiquinone biosynthesis monooxygenase Coq7